MPAQTDFASRIARIEARNTGKGPKQAVIAPFVGEDVKSMERLMRPRRSGLRRVMLVGGVLVLACAIFAEDIAPMLPEGMQPHARALAVAFDDTLTGALGGAAQASPDDSARPRAD